MQWRTDRAKHYPEITDVFIEPSGVGSKEAFSEPRVMVHRGTVDFLRDLLRRAKIKCPKCRKRLQVVVKGRWFDKCLFIKCKGRKCKDKRVKHPKIFRGSVTPKGHHPMNLSAVYHTLKSDTGYKGIQSMAHALCLESRMSKHTYYVHANSVYQIMNEYYKKNMENVYVAVCDFYKRHELGKVEVVNGREIVNICVITDGTYDHRGKTATHGTSFAFERFTGVPLDVSVAEKCRLCKDRDTYETNGKCQYNKFHGSSGDMEKFNILQLFLNSLKLGFKYTTLVMDGDCSVLPSLNKLKPYGEQKIHKLECKSHLGKRARSNLSTWGDTWTLPLGKSREEARVSKKTEPKTVKKISCGVLKVNASTKEARGRELASRQRPGTSDLVPAQKRKVLGGDFDFDYHPVKFIKQSTRLGKAQAAAGPTQRSMFGFVVRESRSSDVVSKEPIQTSQMDQETLPSPSPSGKPGADTLKTLRSERVSQAMDCANPLQSSSDEKMLVDDVGSQLTLDTDTSRLAVSEVPDIAGAQDTPSSSSQPDEGDPQPESLFKQCFTTHPEVVKDITQSNNRKYLIKSRFGVQNMHRIAHLYVLAVYDHADQGTAMQTKQVFAILFHELDHQWTTDDQRSYYHQYCGSWCRFSKWIKDGESAGSYSHVDSSWVEDKNKGVETGYLCWH